MPSQGGEQLAIRVPYLGGFVSGGGDDGLAVRAKIGVVDKLCMPSQGGEQLAIRVPYLGGFVI
ncbi:hypothetical protein NIES4071_05860 [Calothrix sp. NIES-4071]|nr:hypothetical protein NIES4071_05860 [Calothrix sp. NIES-4071]